MFLYLFKLCADVKDYVMNLTRSGSVEKCQCFADIAFAVFLKLERLMR